MKFRLGVKGGKVWRNPKVTSAEVTGGLNGVDIGEDFEDGKTARGKIAGKLEQPIKRGYLLPVVSRRKTTQRLPCQLKDLRIC